MNKSSDSKITPGLIDGIIGDVAPKDGSFEVVRLSSPSALCHVSDWLSSGCLPVDLITGGGFPVGRLTELYGDSATGKSLLATHAVVEAQARDWLTIFVDTESAVSEPLMRQVGVDTDRLLYMTPNTINDVFDTVEKVLDAKDKELGKDHPTLFVWDTVAATTTASEVETVGRDGLDKQQFSSAARQISMALRTGWHRRIARSNVCAIFVNQVRENVGVMFGEKHSTFGGKAIGFYASLRLELRIVASIKEAGEVNGYRVRVTVKKSRTHPPFKVAEMPVYFGYGFDEAEATFDFLKDYGVLSKGAWQTLELGGQELKFQKSGWTEPGGIFDAHFDEICKLAEEAYRDSLNR